MGFCKSNQKSIPVVGFLTHNDCDVLRAKTGGYRRFTHRTIIPPTLAEPDPFPQCAQPPPPPVEIDSNIEYEVSEILNSKLDRHFQGNRPLCYLVCWSRYEGM